MLSPGTIVIVNTKDIGRGRVRCPAIIRYYDAGHDVYECNVLNIGQNPESFIALIDWWPVGKDEIEEVCELSGRCSDLGR